MKKIVFLFSILWMNLALACPMCGGAGQSTKDKYTTLILIGFILLGYIPYMIIFDLIKKFKDVDNTNT